MESILHPSKAHYK